MALRRLLRSSVPRSDIEAIAAEVSRRYGGSSSEVTLLEADNWLSVPCVVDDRWFVKVIADQHTVMHALLTASRNIGAFSAGTEGFFERFETPLAMAEHELAATRRIREIGINAPEPLEAFEHDGYGVVVLEYLPYFRTLDELSAEDAKRFAPRLFGALRQMHGAGFAHGDLRAENVLIAPAETDGLDLYFIDATRVRDDAIDDARAYDLACALGSLEPLVGASPAVAAALEYYRPVELLAAREFLDFVGMRPDHDFDATLVKGEIEKAAA